MSGGWWAVVGGDSDDGGGGDDVLRDDASLLSAQGVWRTAAAVAVAGGIMCVRVRDIFMAGGGRA